MDMKINSFVNNYYSSFRNAIADIVVTDGRHKEIDFSIATEKIVAMLEKAIKENKKVMMVGNGGSAAIASHQAVDYWKNGKIKSTAFNDSSLLTCLSNDYSYAEVFSKAVEMFGDQGDILFCISSSGKSHNILNAAAEAKKKKCSVITFSGFEKGNPLRKAGICNFYVPSKSYGFVEIIHLLIIHSILDAKMYCRDGVDVFEKNKKRRAAISKKH